MQINAPPSLCPCLSVFGQTSFFMQERIQADTSDSMSPSGAGIVYSMHYNHVSLVFSFWIRTKYLQKLKTFSSASTMLFV